MVACHRGFFVCLVAGVISLMPTALLALAPPPISAKAAVVMDAETGTVLYGHNPDLPLPPASTTKIVTALLLAQLPPTTPITATTTAASMPGLALGVQPNRSYSARTLLYAMLLKSANDAAEAVGEALGPGIPAFSAKMNQLAAKAGATHSHFVNPDGLDAPGHLATARDLALIARMAMNNPAFARAVGTHSTKIDLPGGRIETLVNTDTLLGSVPGMEGIKTGYTAKAGYCFVGEALVHGRQIITVVLHSTNWQTDTRSLLHYAGILKHPSAHHTALAATRSGQANPHNSPMIGRATPPGIGPSGFTDSSAASKRAAASSASTVPPPAPRSKHWTTRDPSRGSQYPVAEQPATAPPNRPLDTAPSGGSPLSPGSGSTSTSSNANDRSTPALRSIGAAPNSVKASTGPTNSSESGSTGVTSGSQPSNVNSTHPHDISHHASTVKGQDSGASSRGIAVRLNRSTHRVPSWVWWMLLLLLVATLLLYFRRLYAGFQFALRWLLAFAPKWRYKMKTKGFPWNRSQSAPLLPVETPVERPARKAKSSTPETPPLIYDAQPPIRCDSKDWMSKLVSTPARLLEPSVLRHARAVLECVPPAYAAALLPLLQSPTTKIRTSAATLLMPYTARKSEEILLAAMQDEKSGADLRAECAATLARHTNDRYEKTWVQLLLGDGFLPAAAALASLPWLDEGTTKALKHVLDQERQLQTDSEVVLRTNTRDAAIAAVLTVHGHLANEVVDSKLHELPARQRENIISALFLESDHPVALHHAVHAALHSKSGYALPALMRANPESVTELLDAAEERADAAEKTRIMIVKWLLFNEGEEEQVQKLAGAGNDLAVAASAIAQHSHWKPENQEPNVLTAAARIVSLRLGYGDYTPEEISRAFRRASADDEANAADLPAGLQELSQAYQHPEVYSAVQSALKSDDGIEQLAMSLAKHHGCEMAMDESAFWSDKLGREFRLAHLSELGQESGDAQRNAMKARTLDPDPYIRAAARRALVAMPDIEQSQPAQTEPTENQTKPSATIDQQPYESGDAIDAAA